MKRNGISLLGRAKLSLLYSELSLATQGAEKEVEIEVLFMKRYWNVFGFDFYCFISRCRTFQPLKPVDSFEPANNLS